MSWFSFLRSTPTADEARPATSYPSYGQQKYDPPARVASKSPGAQKSGAARTSGVNRTGGATLGASRVRNRSGSPTTAPTQGIHGSLAGSMETTSTKVLTQSKPTRTSDLLGASTRTRDYTTEYGRSDAESGIDAARARLSALDSGHSGDRLSSGLTPPKVSEGLADTSSPDMSQDNILGSLEDYINQRYDPFIDFVKELTKDVKKATKMLQRSKMTSEFAGSRDIFARDESAVNLPTSPGSKALSQLAADKGVDAGTVRVIICALDYPGTEAPLTATVDGDNMQELCKSAGITDVSVLYNNQANAEAVSAKIKRVASRCQPGDFFVFYYAGHGAQIPDEDGDEKDGYDEAFCFVTPDGKLRGGWMSDDTFAELMTTHIPQGVKVLVLSDCCHSGTVCDFKTNPAWKKLEAVSFSGCEDFQTSGDTGRGGIFTHALLIAIQRMLESREPFDKIGNFFSRVIEVDDEVFDSEQEIKMMASPICDKKNFPWPIVPKPHYKAPFKSRSSF